MAKRWTEDEDDRLRECVLEGMSGAETAEEMDRPESGVRARASALNLKFESGERRAVLDALRRGLRLIREDVGGAIGVRWGDAARNEGAFSAEVCERLLSRGDLRPIPERPHIFKARADLW